MIFTSFRSVLVIGRNLSLALNWGNFDCIKKLVRSLFCPFETRCSLIPTCFKGTSIFGINQLHLLLPQKGEVWDFYIFSCFKWHHTTLWSISTTTDKSWKRLVYCWFETHHPSFPKSEVGLIPQGVNTFDLENFLTFYTMQKRSNSA